jgi:hypothetical protein
MFVFVFFFFYSCQRRRRLRIRPSAVDIRNTTTKMICITLTTYYESYLEDYLINESNSSNFFQFFQIVHFDLLETNISVFVFYCKKKFNEDFHLFKIFTSITSTIVSYNTTSSQRLSNIFVVVSRMVIRFMNTMSA